MNSFFASFLLSIFAFCGFAFGSNLLLNSSFQVDGNAYITDWTLDQFQYASDITHLPGDGIDGSNAVRLDLSKMTRFSQPGLTLVAGEKYLLGGYVRSKNFKAARKSIGVYNTSWANEVGTAEIPETTDGWLKLEAEVTAPESRDNRYTFAIIATQSEGTVDFCAPFLKALTDRGREESKTASAQELDDSRQRLVPISPLLSKIDINRPVMEFYFAPFLSKGLDAYELQISTQDGKSADFSAPVAFPLLPGQRSQVTMNNLQLGSAQLRAKLIEKETGLLIAGNTYPIQVIEGNPLVNAKPLNNLVSELPYTAVTATEYSFVNPREGWVYLALDKASKESKAYLNAAATPVIIYRPEEAAETMRFLPPGKHQLRLEAAVPGSQLTIRVVPQLMVYPLTISEKTDISRYQWGLDFFRRHFWHSYNLHNTGIWSPNNKLMLAYDQELKERGIDIIGSVSLRNIPDAASLVGSIRNSQNLPATRGVTLDELSSSARAEQITTVTEACWELQDFDKLVYTWISDSCKLNIPIYHKNLFSACTNVSGGKGKILLETYISPRPTEAEAERYLKDYLAEVMYHIRQCAPDGAERVMLLLTGLTTNGGYNVNVYPQVDIRYYFDMFFQQLVTNPDTKDIFGMGCYSTSHCEEDLLRWICKLVRHYGIEGNTEMLSKQYGLTYLPEHLQNCDFENGLANWQAQPAGKDSLRALTIERYGRNHQRRRGADKNLGDTSAYFERQVGSLNILSQTAVNLVPGKLYSLTFVTADPEDIEKVKNIQQQPMLRVSLTAAEVIKPLSYDISYPRRKRRGKQTGEIISSRVVFKAKADKVEVKFSDKEGRPGQKRILNFISLKPYIAE